MQLHIMAQYQGVTGPKSSIQEVLKFSIAYDEMYPTGSLLQSVYRYEISNTAVRSHRLTVHANITITHS